MNETEKKLNRIDTEIKEYENLIEMCQDEHFQADMYLDNLQEDNEKEISKVENELEAIENDIQIYLTEIKNLKAKK
jgi:chromosome segregation ATPase